MTIRSWRNQFQSQGLAKLGKVAPGRGRRPTIPQEVIERIVELTQHELDSP